MLVGSRWLRVSYLCRELRRDTLLRKLGACATDSDPRDQILIATDESFLSSIRCECPSMNFRPLLAGVALLTVHSVSTPEASTHGGTPLLEPGVTREAGANRGEVPGALLELCEHLQALRGPLFLSVQLHRKAILVPEQKECTSHHVATLNSWVTRTLTGAPPSYAEALGLFHSEMEPCVLDVASGGIGGRFLTSTYAKRNAAVAFTLQLESGHSESSLLTLDAAYRFRSSTNQVTVRDQDGTPPTSPADPGAVLAPLRTEDFYIKFLRSSRWETPASSRLTTYKTRSAVDPNYQFAVCYEEGQRLPFAVVDLTLGPRGELAYVLTFYRRIAKHEQHDTPIGAYETLRFDSLGVADRILMERTLLFRCDALSTDGPSQAEPLKLPVIWTNGTKLRDLRSEAAEVSFGTDVGLWPEALLGRLQPW